MRKSVAMASVQLGLSLTWATSSAQRGTTPKATSVGAVGRVGNTGAALEGTAPVAEVAPSRTRFL